MLNLIYSNLHNLFNLFSNSNDREIEKLLKSNENKAKFQNAIALLESDINLTEVNIVLNGCLVKISISC